MAKHPVRMTTAVPAAVPAAAAVVEVAAPAAVATVEKTKRWTSGSSGRRGLSYETDTTEDRNERTIFREGRWMS